MYTSTHRIFAIIGLSIFVLGSLIRFVVVVIGFIQASSALGAGGAPNAQVLSEGIQLATLGNFIGLALGLVGLIVLAIVVFGFTYRKPWMWWGMILSCIGYVGIFVIPVVVYLLGRKADFWDSSDSVYDSIDEIGNSDT